MRQNAQSCSYSYCRSCVSGSRWELASFRQLNKVIVPEIREDGIAFRAFVPPSIWGFASSAWWWKLKCVSQSQRISSSQSLYLINGFCYGHELRKSINMPYCRLEETFRMFAETETWHLSLDPNRGLLSIISSSMFTIAESSLRGQQCEGLGTARETARPVNVIFSCSLHF